MPHENKLRTLKQAPTNRCLPDGTPQGRDAWPLLAWAGGRNLMNAWSDYLREQADIADRYAKTMTTAETVKEFVDIAESFRRDADAEDANPTYKH
jgi:hypothetical protein